MRYVFLLLILLVSSCQLKEVSSDKIVARVNNQYLYASEVNDHIRANLSSADSTSMAKNYINAWVKEQLLLEKAVFNLNPSQQTSLENLIRQYRNDIFIKTYQEEWLKSRMDTLVTPQEIEAYYKENKQNFKLHQDLVRGRYVQLPLANFNKASVSRALRRFNDSDRNYLDSISLQFNSAYLNDSVWFRPQAFFNRINRSSPQEYDRYLKSKRFFEIEDSIDLYLVFVEEVRRRNEIAPLSHLNPTLKQILLNKRKLETMRQFDNDILEEAIKNKTLEIYE
ncbi:MAG: peptidyl-prolyl cis-trans isomerase [Flavobacteriaceae bacterium]|jgi:hypothetical protein|nr:peptidyl-prolyl cis-trans isomerase [Flavobacteriaceae bacterium]MDG2289824.1 peptidyl-prolyl cis-trans isomerase [Flavobacteriaceae bacterium]